MAETIAALLAAYRDGKTTPEQIVARCYTRLAAHNDPAMFISVRDAADAIADARALPKDPASLPLFGIPFAASVFPAK